jgi:BON domain-containing protein
LKAGIVKEDAVVTGRSRSLFAAAAGLWMALPLPAQEPARINLDPAAPPISQTSPSPNQQLADTIAQRLRESRKLWHYNLAVTCQDGAADLIGSVTDEAQRAEVLRVVQGVSGVLSVEEHLVLDQPLKLVQAAEPPTLPEPSPMMPRPMDQGGIIPGPVPGSVPGEPVPIYQAPPATPYDLNPPKMPPYAWPTYAPYNNNSRVAYPNLYPYQSWPFIGPIYPFPKIPPGWRKISLEWQDGYWWYGSNANSHDWWRLRYW